MQIKKLSDTSSQQRKIANSYINQISILNHWNTPNLIERLEKSNNPNHGAYIFIEDEKMIGFFTVSDSDGNNANSDNFGKFQTEANAHWITSMYVLPNAKELKNNAFIHAINHLHHLLEKSNIYIYIENKKLVNIMSSRYNAIFVSKSPLIMKISQVTYNIPMNTR